MKVKTLCQDCLKANVVEVEKYEDYHSLKCDCGGDLCACKHCQTDIEVFECLIEIANILTEPK